MTNQQQHDAVVAMKDELQKCLTDLASEVTEMLEDHGAPYKVTITFTFERKETH